MSVDGGTHEFSRVYFHDGQFQLGHGNDKLGPCRLVRANLSSTGISTMYMHDGRVVETALSLVQSLTYHPA